MIIPILAASVILSIVLQTVLYRRVMYTVYANQRAIADSPRRIVRLSKEAKEARKPLPPEELFDALQDRVHKDVGNGRAARTVRGKKVEK